MNLRFPRFLVPGVALVALAIPATALGAGGTGLASTGSKSPSTNKVTNAGTGGAGIGAPATRVVFLVASAGKPSFWAACGVWEGTLTVTVDEPVARRSLVAPPQPANATVKVAKIRSVIGRTIGYPDDYRWVRDRIAAGRYREPPVAALALKSITARSML